MGAAMRLTESEWDALDRLRFSAKSADVFRNCLIVLKSSLRETIASIAEELGCCTDTVKRVRRRYRKEGIAGLHPIKPPGRPGRATPDYLARMRMAVGTNPLTLGYGFSTWSAIRLSGHLAKETGIHFSDDQMRRLLHAEGFSVHRPKHTLKGKRDEVAYLRAKKQLQRRKKTP
jgi:transposase